MATAEAAAARVPAQTRTPAPAPAPARELEPTPARAGAHGGGGGGGGDCNVDILTVLRTRDKLKEQLMECKTAVLSEKEKFLDYPAEENFIQSATEDLQKNIEEVKVSFQNKTLALQRIQIMDALRKKLKQNDEDSRLILETRKRILLLSRTIIEYQEQARHKEQELIDIKRKRLLLKNRLQKLQEMQTTMKKEKEKRESVDGVEIQEMLQTLQNTRKTTTILQNVLQGIIFGSTVNWAEDPSLKAIVLKLEKNVYFQ
ncbi:centromere protein H [Oenanthe melanoleuca]|uniref:centromere protein H n=1 Tax=Oenanthe melanoleuca TaxID=2939378 RepID=UPI0024C167C7|nr:centromere protein H [Oenanthe melanoleuca]